jgi:hypothetical protein
MALYSSAEIYQPFEGTFCLHFCVKQYAEQAGKEATSRAAGLLGLLFRPQDEATYSSKFLVNFTKLYGVTSLMTAL